MIYELIIKNTKDSKFSYVSSKNNKTKFSLPFNKIEFKKGKNILIGENGCGKSTIIKMIAKFTFCEKNEYSIITDNNLKDLFLSDNNPFSIDIKANYNIATYKSLYEDDKDKDDILSNFESFGNSFYRKRMSSGERTVSSIRGLLTIMFSGKNIEFNKKHLNLSVNDIWEKHFNDLKEYFSKNHIDEKHPIFTILMDEPDRNLSLKNVKQLYTILSEVKENEQMICAIHNPILIYKLSRLNHINFIELTDNYLNKIIEFVEK